MKEKSVSFDDLRNTTFKPMIRAFTKAIERANFMERLKDYVGKKTQMAKEYKLVPNCTFSPEINFGDFEEKYVRYM
jgi:hypothetical protein